LRRCRPFFSLLLQAQIVCGLAQLIRCLLVARIYGYPDKLCRLFRLCGLWPSRAFVRASAESDKTTTANADRSCPAHASIAEDRDYCQLLP
jgi:hypothetical protein